jgi:hypothetical protein
MTFILPPTLDVSDWMKEMVMTEELPGTQSYLSETQPQFHRKNSILRSLHFSAMQPYCSITSTGTKQAEMGVIGDRELGRPMAVNGPKNCRKKKKIFFQLPTKYRKLH